jgi:hypothetical protein
VIEPQAMPSPPAALPDTWNADVVILPRQVAEGIGLYDDSVVTVAKELRAAGTSAEYAHGPEAREWIGEKSVALIALSLIVGIASNAGWDGLRALIGRAGSKRVRVRVARVKESPEGREAEWFELDGPGAEVADALKALQPRNAATTRERDDEPTEETPSAE